MLSTLSSGRSQMATNRIPSSAAIGGSTPWQETGSPTRRVILITLFELVRIEASSAEHAGLQGGLL
ncbi:hypothetical protein IE53DRAFT_383788 [Violaceomyces palustris]|uniref:Uncharacterized protein n=1 Tax=Violaceomyces palustris TaxID=1673888 RepID=A0ACD0P6G2_9BASI|nr:hypothetical protein IE53DRAFT_383788 [Violaceomyces palustris]